MQEEKKAEQHFRHKMLSSSKGFSFCYLERLHTSADFNNDGMSDIIILDQIYTH